MMAAAALAGALLLLGPALLKSRLGVDEVVTTLLLNFIVLLFVSLMLDGPMKDPTAMGWPQSVALQDALQLDKLVARSRLHSGLLWALALAAGAVGAAEVQHARLRDPRGRRQRARGCLRRHAGGLGDGEGGAAVGRAGRAGRCDRSGRPQRLPDARHVARVTATAASSSRCWRR